MEEGLLFDESGPVEAPGAEGHCRHQGQERLAGGQGARIGEVQEFLTAAMLVAIGILAAPTRYNGTCRPVFASLAILA